jgi:enoyl-CoA hydratase/carnithine racemase
MSEHIKSTRSGGVLTLLIDRPSKKNALTEDMYAALADGLDAGQSDPEVRVILLRGSGDLFCAGNDLGEFAAVAAGGKPPQNVIRFILSLVGTSKPVVAAAQGRAVGVGATMLLHCDYIILAEGTQLTMPFAGLALVPEAGSSLLLPQRIGHARAFAMFALGEAVDAQSACAWGLANQVVPADSLVSRAEEVARRLAAQPVGALIATKKLMRDPEALIAHMKVESQCFFERLTTAEAREAFTAFAERRAPDFTKAAGQGS